MATFGHYEADRPLYRTAFSTVYLLRSAEEGGRQRVIKAQRPSVRMHDEMLEAIQSQAFLDSAAVQQKVARFEATSWAPIHEFGTASSGPFYVTDRYDFSIQWLVDGHVKLGAAGVHNIASSIVRGLLALQQACQRPHGNLKSTNILIAGRRDIAKAKIVLCDPLPNCHLDPNAHAKADLRRLGEIIHQVVVHSCVPQITGYQVPDSPHWRKLGKQGEAWRHLCNRLLQANVESTPITLEDLANQLISLAPRPARRALLLAPVGGLVLLCVVVARLSCSPSHPPVSVEEAVSAYNRCFGARDWLAPLCERLTQDLDKIKKRRYLDHPWMKNDPNLKELNLIGRYADVFAQRIPKSEADLLNDSDLRNDVADANEARVRIEDLFFHQRAEGYWPWLAQLGRCAGKFKEVGCKDMSDFLTQHVIPDANSRDDTLADHIARAFDLKQYRSDLEQCRQHIDLKRLLPEDVRDDPDRRRPIAGADVKEFARRIGEIKRRIEQPRDWLLRIRGETADRTGMSQAMKERCQSYLDSMERAYGLDEKNRTPEWSNELWSAKADIERTVDNLMDLDQMLARTLETKSASKPWSKDLCQYYESKQRRAIIEGITLKVGGKDTFPAPDKYLPEWKDLLDWPARATALVQDFNDLETALSKGYLLGEEPPYAGAKRGSIKSIYKRWDEKNGDRKYVAVLQDAQKQIAELRRITKTVQMLVSIEGLKDANALLQKTEDPNVSMSIKCAAWRELGETAGAKEPLLERLRQRGVCPARTEKLTAKNLVSFQSWPRSALAKILEDRDWPIQYDLEEFRNDHPQYFREPDPFRPLDLKKWQSDLPNYKRVPDPRGQPRLSEGLRELESQIAAGLQESVDDRNLVDDREQCRDLSKKVDDVEKLANIPKYEVTIAKTWAELGNELTILRGKVEEHKLPECRYLTISQGSVKFTANVGLDAFEPVEWNSSGSGAFGPLNRSTRRGFKGDPAFEKARAQVPEGADNPMWPKYIRASKDHSVVLRFVPQRDKSAPDAFYMAIHEITNEQYQMYLRSHNPRGTGIRSTELSAHPYSSRFDSVSRGWRARKSDQNDPNAPQLGHPVVWVTYEGAKDYATAWLGANLPSTREHQYAAGLVDPVVSNYSDPDKYHVRARLWVEAAKALVRHLKDPQYTGIPIAPSGADDLDGESKAAYDSADLPDNLKTGRYKVFWPTASQEANEAGTGDMTTRGYRIYDLIGNVWEWCEDRTCCGGSCLSSLKDLPKVPVLTPKRASDPDLGFRVVVRPAPKAK